MTESFAGQTYQTDYQENEVTYGTVTRTQTLTDGQVTSVAIETGENTVLSSAYTYDEETGLPATATNTYGNTADTRTYAYNDEGKLTSVTRGNQTTQYFYDLSGQLVRVNDPANNQTVVVGYQGVSGNIASVTTYPYTTDETILATGTTVNYTYGDTDRGDLLTNFNGHPMTYDRFGNLQSYNGFTYTWQAGRRLTGMTDGVNNTYAYQYDDNGIRTQKTVNSTTTRYTAVDGRITGQYDGTNTLYFRYDEADSLIGFNLNGTEYVYLKNMQGDIEGILDNSGNVVVQYAYNAWGKVLSSTGTLASTVGAINPMRYRGYYQDDETGYYYLQSRYYDPEIGRFINADEPSMLSITLDDIVGVNLYTYCNNDPVNNVDINGHFTLMIAGIALSVGEMIAILAVMGFFVIYICDKDFRNSVNQFITIAIQGLIDGVGYLTNVITDSIRASRKGKKYNGYELHHIVAQSDRRAISSRKLLAKYGISVYVKENLVSIKTTLHRHLHSNAYHIAVGIILKASEMKRGSWYEKRQRILATLIGIGAVLRFASNLV